MSEAKHRSWWVTIPGRKPFAMGGEPMTKAEALETARVIWPREEVSVEPAMTEAQEKAGQD